MMCDFYNPLLTKKGIGNISKILGKVRSRHYGTETQGDELMRRINISVSNMLPCVLLAYVFSYLQFPRNIHTASVFLLLPKLFSFST